MTRFSVPRLPLRPTLGSFLVMLAMLATATACGRFRRGDDLEQRAVIVFINQSLDQADVFAIASNQEAIRIGTVMPGRTESLWVPATVTSGGTVNIVARLLSRSYAPQSGPISLVAGDRVQITLPLDARTLTVLPGE